MVRERFKGYRRGRSAVSECAGDVRKVARIRINRAAWRVAAAKRFYSGMGALGIHRQEQPKSPAIPSD